MQRKYKNSHWLDRQFSEVLIATDINSFQYCRGRAKGWAR